MVTGDLPNGRLLWLRWSWRDLRQHWVAVVAIALVMAIGVGVFAGLGSTATWRRMSNDESFAALGMHDLQVTLSPGTFVDEGALVAAVEQIEDAAAVSGAAERLVVSSQVDASTTADSVLVAARVVGMDFGVDPVIDGVWISDGATPDTSTGGSVGVLEAKFAEHWGLPPVGSVTLGGNRRLDYVGLGMIPEDFFYEGPKGSIMSMGELAPVYMPLAAAQEVAGRFDQVNDVVLILHDGADRDLVENQLVSTFDALGIGATVSSRDDAPAVRILYDDIENDQRFWNILAGLILGAAGLAAFNLVSRIVEAQRREIGIGMALGMPKAKLAIRPLLVGLQVALLGTIAGVGVGLWVGSAMKDLLDSFLPLPVYVTPFQPGVFARAAVLGLAIPIAASALPVWRALRVEPIEAIRTGHLTAKASRLTDWTGRLRLPFSSITLMPIRNVLRSPRRTFLTAVGVGAAITALVAVLGMLDSIGRSVDQIGDEFKQANPDRVLVQLDTFYPTSSDTVAAIGASAAIGTTDSALRLPVVAGVDGPDDDLELLVELLDFGKATWTPTLLTTANQDTSGIVLAQKAADDLGVRPGDTVHLRHPERTGMGTFVLAESDVVVMATHSNPLRTFAYMPLSEAERFGLADTVNLVHAYPAPGATSADVQRAVFDLPGVASSQAVARISEGFAEALERFVGIVAIAALAVLALALLIAFNATRITVDERRREHATMRAFGVSVTSVMGVVVAESVIIGIAATVIGLVAGLLVLDSMLTSLANTTLPDLGIASYLSPSTILIAAAVGIAAVAIAPLFLTHRIRRMDIPDTLRVME